VSRALTAAVALVATLAVCIPGAFGKTDVAAAPQATPGVTNSSIVIGGTYPLSGPASLYAPIPRGMEA
jgi:branched-chain amino acid transport system substrate-binding protein